MYTSVETVLLEHRAQVRRVLWEINGSKAMGVGQVTEGAGRVAGLDFTGSWDLY